MIDAVDRDLRVCLLGDSFRPGLDGRSGRG